MTSAALPLAGFRILSLALNLPGPAALMRARALGAECTKLEPPAGDPMRHYSPQAYADLHAGVRVLEANLKTDEGQALLHEELARSDLLLTSFRPSALARLGLDWERLHARHPALSQVAIVGALGERAEEPGHDLTYQAEHGLVPGLSLPPTLYADMGGALEATQAILQAALAKGRGMFLEVGLAEAAGFLALPLRWGLTTPDSPIGGAHAGYRVYACADGRVAVAALEPHFARSLGEVAGVPMEGPQAPASEAARTGLATFFAARTRAELEQLAARHDIPLHTLPA